MLAPAALKVGESLGARARRRAHERPRRRPRPTGTTKTDQVERPHDHAQDRRTKPPARPKKGEAGSPDERLEMLEIQRLVEKQNQLFTLVSNLMKSMHDTSMVAIQNVR